MKTKSFSALFAVTVAAAGLFFTACDNDDEGYTPVKASINATIHPMETRASNTMWAADDAIGISAVTGAVTYTNVQYKADGAGKFSVVNSAAGEDNSIYFQDENAVNFTAYYPYAGSNGTLPGTNGIISRTITAADQVAAAQPAIDYLFGTGSGSSTSPQVELSFKHSMCRFILNFKTGEGVSALSEITYTLGGVKMDGTFNATTGVAEVTSGATAKDLIIKVPQAGEMKSALILFPGQMGASQKFSLKVEMDGRTYECKDIQVVATGEPTQPGYSYTHNVTLDKENLTVEPATITPWEEVPGSDITVTY